MADAPTIRELLRQYAAVLEDLRSTEAIRSKNNPVADYAEWLITKSLKLELAPKSSKGFDASCVSGTRYEIKARRLTPDNPSRQLSAIRSLEDRHFDYLAAVLFERDFTVYRAALIPLNIVKDRASYRAHTNSWVLQLSDSVWAIPEVQDITSLVQETESKH